MKRTTILFIVFSATLLAFAGWFTILQTIDPFTTDLFSKAMFYVFALVFVWGIIAMTLYYIRKRHAGNLNRALSTSVRQGFISSLGIIGLIALQTINVLNILSASVYIIALVLIEFYYNSKNPNYA